MAATAATRLGLAPRLAHRESPRVHGDGRSNSDEEPAEPLRHITRGSRRDQRPALHHVRRDFLVEPHAAMPVLLQPLSGHSSDAPNCGQSIADHMAQLPLTYGLPSLVAARALSRAEHLQKLAETRTPWIPRVPATWWEAQAVLAQAAPQTMARLMEQ